VTPDQEKLVEELMPQARGVPQCGAHTTMRKQWGPQIGRSAWMGCTDCAVAVTKFFVEKLSG